MRTAIAIKPGLSACSLIAMATVGLQAAHAQTDDLEIIVTGQRKEEPLQKAPVSVTVIDGETLAAAGVKRAADFVSMTPGVSFVGGTIGVGDNQVNIRGINSARDAGASFAYVVDGILIPNPETFNRTYVDLQQIEVLKGPQGAIYGRNAESGAIVVTTRKPTNELEASSMTGVGENATVYNQSTISGPLIRDVLFARLSVDYRHTDGFYRNRYLDEKSVDRDEAFGINGRIIWQPTDDSSLDLKLRYNQVKSSAINFNAVYQIPAFEGFLGPLVNEDVNNHQFDYVYNITPEEKQTNYEASLKYERDLGGMKLSAYFAYARTKDYILSDGTFGGFGFFDNANNVTGTNVCQASIAALGASGFVYPAPQNAGFLGPYTATACDGYQYLQNVQSDYSAEVRVTSDPSAALRWAGGLYFVHSVREDGLSVGNDLGRGITKSLLNPLDSNSPTAQLYSDRFTNYALGAFGSADWDMTPQLTASFGLRYDIEWRRDQSLVPADYRQYYINVEEGGPANGAFYPLNPGLLANPNGIPSKSATFSQPQPKVSLRYTPVPAVTIYGSFGIGFKSGGFNRAGTQATIENIAAATGSNVTIGDSYAKEVSYAIELGMKGRLFDRRLSYQLALYQTYVDNMQYAEFFTNSQGQLRVVSNIDRVDLSGIELGVQLKVANWLSLTGGGNITDSKIKKNAVRVDTVGNKSPYTPAYTAELGATLNKPLTGALSLTGNISTNFTGPTWFSTVQNNFVPTIFGASGYYGRAKRAAFTTTNLRVGIAGPHFEVVAFARNLFNEKYLTEVSPAPEFGGSFASQGPGRMFGGELTLKL